MLRSQFAYVRLTSFGFGGDIRVDLRVCTLARTRIHTASGLPGAIITTAGPEVRTAGVSSNPEEPFPVESELWPDDVHACIT